MQRLAAARPEGRLVRINLEHPNVPQQLTGRAIGIAASADDVLQSLI
jgi:hypothetical protein